MELNGEIDRYNGIHIELMTESDYKLNSDQEFENSLKEALQEWISRRLNASWFQIGLKFTHLIPIFVKFGYTFHYSKTDYVVLNKWLSQTEPKNIPDYGYTCVGVGGLVIDDSNRVLVVKERYFIGKQMWKFPGGYAIQSEDFGQTAIREVLEETGIECEFVSVVGLRHIHKGLAFRCSEIYIVCHLRPIGGQESSDGSCGASGLTVKRCPQEIADCKWIAMDELMPQLSQFNAKIGDKYLFNTHNKVVIGLESIPSMVGKDTDLKTYTIHKID